MTKRTFLVGPGVHGDIDRLISTRLLIQANSGGGKSFTLRRLLEQTHGAVQQIVIDPEGEFSSLREKFDYILAARQGGDTAADPRTAKLLAERLLELGVSAILDIYELNPHERIKFVQLFLEALVDAPKQLWHPVLVVIDEAHTFCPEKEQAESSTAVKALCSRGRKRGFCAVLATQRLSKLAKDAAAECNNKLIGRTSLDVDMARAGDELGFTKADRLVLRDLEDGEFFAFGPALTRTVTRVKVGPVATRHPEAGSKLAAVVPPPTDKVKALLPKLSDLPAEAEAREKTVADLKRELATTRRELTEARKAQPPAPKEVQKRIDVLTDADRALLEKFSGRIQEAASLMHEDLVLANGRLQNALHLVGAEYLEAVKTSTGKAENRLAAMLDMASVKKILGKLATVPAPTPTTPQSARTAPRSPLAGRVPPGLAQGTSTRPARQVSPTPDGLGGPEIKILTSLAELEALGLHPADKQQLGLMAGYTNVRSGGFSEPLGRLTGGGYVTSPRAGIVAITDVGRALVGPVNAPSSSAELQARILEKLSGPEQKLLRVLLAEYPNAVTKEWLGAQCNYTNIRSGGFSEPLGHLSTLGLVESPERGTVVAAPSLFLEH